MRAGKLASLGLVVIVTAVGTVLSLGGPMLPWMASQPPVVHWCIVAGGLFLVCLVLLLPLGAALDRTVNRLMDYLEATGSPDGKATPFLGPKWVRPISGAFTMAVEPPSPGYAWRVSLATCATHSARSAAAHCSHQWPPFSLAIGVGANADQVVEVGRTSQAAARTCCP